MRFVMVRLLCGVVIVAYTRFASAARASWLDPLLKARADEVRHARGELRVAVGQAVEEAFGVVFASHAWMCARVLVRRLA